MPSQADASWRVSAGAEPARLAGCLGAAAEPEARSWRRRLLSVAIRDKDGLKLEPCGERVGPSASSQSHASPHGAWLVGLLAITNALLGMSLGLFLSAFARTEFQAVQFMPAFVLLKLLLCALFVSRDEMAGACTPSRGSSRSPTPTTRSRASPARARSGAGLAVDAAVIALATVGALGAITLRRRTA
jgi:hypothetical protein